MKRICGSVVCLQFARGIWDFWRRNEVRVVVFLGSKNEFVILVAQRLKGRQIESSVSAFLKVFCKANSGVKVRMVAVNHWFDED